MHSECSEAKPNSNSESTGEWIFATLSTSDSFIQAIRILLDSLQIHYRKEIKVEIGCLAWNQDLMDEFRKTYPCFRFRSLEFPEDKNPKEQAIRWKPRFIAQLLNNSPKDSIVIYTDADHIVLRDLTGLFQTMSKFDIGLRHRPEHQGKDLRFAAGIIGVKNSALGRRSILHWDKLVTSNTANWFVDQSTLVELASFCESMGAKIWKMDDNTLSIDSGNKEAYLWSRSNWELGFDERLSENRKLLESMQRLK